LSRCTGRVFAGRRPILVNCFSVNSAAEVSLSLIRRAGLVVAALLLPATLIVAAPSDPTLRFDPKVSLAGRLLVATPSMRDPRFERAVILMTRHTQDGAFGLVINRPIGERSLASLLALIGESSPGATGTVRLFVGGPVQPEAVFVIHSGEYRLPETTAVDQSIGVTSSAKVLRDMAEQKGPAKSLIVLGYAGWAPGQLEGELARNVWYTAPQDPGFVFDEDRDKLWDLATARRTQDL
jgi:putative transcriptional regulator